MLNTMVLRMKIFLTSLQGMALAMLFFSPASPAADSMTTAASIADARMVHNAALLSDGRVLVAQGGVGISLSEAGGITYSTQIFDPVTGAWSTLRRLRCAESTPPRMC